MSLVQDDKSTALHLAAALRQGGTDVSAANLVHSVSGHHRCSAVEGLRRWLYSAPLWRLLACFAGARGLSAPEAGRVPDMTPLALPAGFSFEVSRVQLVGT